MKMAAFWGRKSSREAVCRVSDSVGGGLKALAWTEMTNSKPKTLNLVSASYATPEREWGFWDRNRKRRKAGKEKGVNIWKDGGERGDTLQVILLEDECWHGSPASDHPLDLGEAPILWEVGKKRHVFSAPTPRCQSTSTWLRFGPLEALAWHSGSWRNDVKTQGQIKASHRSLVMVVVTVVMS